MALPITFVFAICVFVFLGLFRLRYGWSQDRWTRSIRYAPTEKMSPAQLFNNLLSANLALLEHDNFNQLASALPQRRVCAILAAHWQIDSPASCRGAILGRMHNLGRVSEEEEAALTAWATGKTLESSTFAALHDVCRFLSMDAQIVSPRKMLDRRFSMMAWDIQQVVYIVRLGLAAGFVQRELAERVLHLVQERARDSYQSWNDFSLAMLVGMGMRSPVDTFDIGGWVGFARSHTVLLAARDTLLQHAAPWARLSDGHRPQPASNGRPPVVLGHAVGAVETHP